MNDMDGAMSVRRLLGTALGMGLCAAALQVLTPGVPAMVATLGDAQRTADEAGPDAVVLAAAGLLSWLVWAWGCVGLLLMAATALPGLLGGVARVAVSVVLPSGARRAAALTLGIGLGIGSPFVANATVPGQPATAAAPVVTTPDGVPGRPVADRAGPAPTEPGAGTQVPVDDDVVPDEAVPDAPGRAPSGVPDWPAAPVAGEHVVLRGDCLWDIAAAHLRQERGAIPTDAAIASAVRAWWTTNQAVIGPDADRLLPGQVLRPPPSP